MRTLVGFVGLAGIVLGVWGLVQTLLRHVGGTIPPWKAKVNALFGAGTVVAGWYLSVGLDFLLPVWVGLFAIAAVYEARKKREDRERSSNASA